MKIIRALLVVSVILAMAAAGGCAKYFRFDFVQEMDLENDEVVWDQNKVEGGITFDPILGVRLNDATISTPMTIVGDLTMTVKFHPNLDVSHTSSIAFILCSDKWPDDFSKVIYIAMYLVGGASSEIYIADWEEGMPPTQHTPNDQPIMGLNLNADNTIVIEKKGNVIKVTLNNELYGPYTLGQFDLGYCYPTLSVYPDFEGTSFGAYIKSIEVKYE